MYMRIRVLGDGALGFLANATEQTDDGFKFSLPRLCVAVGDEPSPETYQTLMEAPHYHQSHESHILSFMIEGGVSFDLFDRYAEMHPDLVMWIHWSQDDLNAGIRKYKKGQIESVTGASVDFPDIMRYMREDGHVVHVPDEKV